MRLTFFFLLCVKNDEWIYVNSSWVSVWQFARIASATKVDVHFWMCRFDRRFWIPLQYEMKWIAAKLHIRSHAIAAIMIGWIDSLVMTIFFLHYVKCNLKSMSTQTDTKNHCLQQCYLLLVLWKIQYNFVNKIALICIIPFVFLQFINIQYAFSIFSIFISVNFGKQNSLISFD